MGMHGDGDSNWVLTARFEELDLWRIHGIVGGDPNTQFVEVCLRVEVCIAEDLDSEVEIG